MAPITKGRAGPDPPKLKRVYSIFISVYPRLISPLGGSPAHGDGEAIDFFVFRELSTDAIAVAGLSRPQAARGTATDRPTPSVAKSYG